MPRVHTRTRKKAETKRPMVCRKCSQPIEVGQSYYTWQKRYGGPQFLHLSCGRPRPSWLSDRKTAIVEDAIMDAETTISEWSPALGETDVDVLREALNAVADEAETIGQDYEESADNMPENLQSGYQAEAMREVATELQDWADNLRAWDPQEDEPALEEGGDEQANEDIHAQWVDQTRGEAEDALADMPEYQG